MKRAARRAVVGMTIAIIALSGIGIAVYYYSGVDAVQPVSGLWAATSWRVQIYLKKSLGLLPELSWPDLLRATMHKGGFSLANVVALGQSVNGALSNPYTSPEDRQLGERIFKERCSRCHGLDGKGAIGPSLARFGYEHGDSDLAVYRVLTQGIAGTAMVPPDLSFAQRWQVIEYLRTLQTHSSGGGSSELPRINIQVSAEQIKQADHSPGEWLTYAGSLNGWRYSSLSEITSANVSQLRLRWVHQSFTNEAKFESTPVVVAHTIFASEPPATVVALDATTGKEIWKYERPIPSGLPICCGKVNRGVAVLGNSVFFGSLDGYLISLDANTGKVNWQVQVARSSDGYAITGAPLIVNHSVVTGVAGGEYGIRGFLAAYDGSTGKQLWKFNTIPGPGEAGHETWHSDDWQHGGGPTWVTGSYDPSLDLLYWGIGNGSPPFSAEGRPGNNLFTESVVALHASTGKLAWYFQFTPHDDHDWDSTQTPILADLSISGAQRKVICWPNRNGFYYVFDRVTGQFLLGKPFVDLNWAQGLTSRGEPILADPNTVSERGRITKPSVTGGVNWQPSAFNPSLGLIFIAAVEGELVFTKSPPDRLTHGENGFFAGSGGSVIAETQLIRALDAATGIKRWEYRSPQGGWGGLLATAGGLVFGTSGGRCSRWTR